MMLKLGSIFVAAGFFLAASGHAYSESLPIFDAFKMFCVDTGMEAQAINSVILAKRGNAQMLVPGFAQTMAFDSYESWSVFVDGRAITVTSSTKLASGTRLSPPQLFDWCSISAGVNDEASVAAMRKWVGIHPTHKLDSVDLYDYSEESGSRKPTPEGNDVALLAEMAKGPIYELTLPNYPRSFLTITLMRSRLAPTH